MFNSQFNAQFNETNFLSAVESDKGIVEFNGYDLTSFCKSGLYGTLIQTWGDEHSFSADIEAYVSSLVDGGGIISKKYGNKIISFSLFIQGENHDDLILRIDELKRRTQGIEANLDIKVRGKYRTYTATLSSLSVPSISAQRNYIEGVRIAFLITSWTWKELENTSEVVLVTWETEKIIDNKGSYEAFPVFSISCQNSWNAMTKININIRKLGELWGNDVYIEETITNNDLIIFDYQRAIVTLNSNEIQFYNPMTPLDTWNNVITITPTWTANLEFSISYNKTYL